MGIRSAEKRPNVLTASQRDNGEARSRREQRGWSGAKEKAQGPRSGTGFCLSRSEAAYREQAQRDNKWGSSPAPDSEPVIKERQVQLCTQSL